MKSIKEQLKELGITQVQVANALDVSKTTINFALNGEYPKEPTFRARFTKLLLSYGISIPKEENEEIKNMLIKKHTISLQAQRKFNIPENLFGDIEDVEQVYANSNITLIREKLKETAMKGKMSAVVGESGSGKTTLVDDLEHALIHNGDGVIFIRPSPIGMAENDKKGNVLKAAHICDAILLAIDPDCSLAVSYQKKLRHMEKCLIESYKAGNKLCIVIEEAHLLNMNTLKHLKGLNEIKVGFQKVLAVILVGQQELYSRMAEHVHQVREVNQRTQFFDLDPIANVQEYLAHVCNYFNVQLSAFIDESGLEAFELLLLRTGQSTAYPLAINNNIIKAINLAAEMGCKVNKTVVDNV